MFALSAATKVYLAAGATDLRKGFEGLCALVEGVLEEAPLSGHVFLFANGARTRLKVLVWDGSGLTLIYKRLDEARFVWPRIEDGVMRLSPGQLGALFEGLDWKRVHSRRVARPQVAQ